MKFCLCLFIFIFLYTSSSFSQNRNIESRISENSIKPLILKNDDVLTFDKNIVILKKSNLFTSYINSSITYTDNVFLNDTNKENDLVLSLSSGLNFDLKMQNGIKLFSGILASQYRYKNNSFLGYNSFQGNAGASYSKNNWLYSIRYTPTVIFDQSYKQQSISLHRFSALVSKSKTFWSKVFTSSYSSAQYARTNPDDFSFYQIDSGVQIIYPVTSKFYMSLNPNIYQKTYINFFEKQTNIERNDIGARLSGNLVFKPSANTDLTFSINYTKNKSTLPNYDYSVKNISPILRFSYKF